MKKPKEIIRDFVDICYDNHEFEGKLIFPISYDLSIEIKENEELFITIGDFGMYFFKRLYDYCETNNLHFRVYPYNLNYLKIRIVSKDVFIKETRAEIKGLNFKKEANITFDGLLKEIEV